MSSICKRSQHRCNSESQIYNRYSVTMSAQQSKSVPLKEKLE